MHICEVCNFRAKRDTLSAYLALFADFKSDEKKWQVNYNEALYFSKGHRTLSLRAPDVAETVNRRLSEIFSDCQNRIWPDSVHQKSQDFIQELAYL